MAGGFCSFTQLLALTDWAHHKLYLHIFDTLYVFFFQINQALLIKYFALCIAEVRKYYLPENISQNDDVHKVLWTKSHKTGVAPAADASYVIVICALQGKANEITQKTLMW